MEKVWTQKGINLNHVELLKLDKDGTEIINDIDRYGELGFSAVTPEDIERFKWIGLYQQVPKADGYFMLRVKIPGGFLNSKQLRVIAGISRDYGRGFLDITTRQALQFHWLTVNHLPDILARLAKAGLSTMGAAGDCPRNVMGHPLAGIDAEEIIDTSLIIQEVNAFFEKNLDFSNLPRKFKISISGSKYNSGHAEINDVALTPASKEINGQTVLGFHLAVGGGLSRDPQFAQKVDAFVLPEEVITVLAGVTSIFRDHGYREKRNHARLKFLIADWGMDKFTEELFKLTGPLLSAGTDLTVGWNGGYFHGVHEQKQKGLSYIGLPIKAGRSSAEEIEELANLSDQYGDGSIRTSNSQNFILANIHNDKIEALLQESLIQRLDPSAASFSAYGAACAGKEFCPFALTKTKQYFEPITQYLDENTTLPKPLRIHITGCPHSCAQPQIADIGLQGIPGKIGSQTVDFFEIRLGGSLGVNATLGTKLQGSVSFEKVSALLKEFIDFYSEHKQEKESFTDFVLRKGAKEFQEKLNSAAA